MKLSGLVAFEIKYSYPHFSASSVTEIISRQWARHREVCLSLILREVPAARCFSLAHYRPLHHVEFLSFAPCCSLSVLHNPWLVGPRCIWCIFIERITEASVGGGGRLRASADVARCSAHAISGSIHPVARSARGQGLGADGEGRRGTSAPHGFRTGWSWVIRLQRPWRSHSQTWRRLSSSDPCFEKAWNLGLGEGKKKSLKLVSGVWLWPRRLTPRPVSFVLTWVPSRLGGCSARPL